MLQFTIKKPLQGIQGKMMLDVDLSIHQGEFVVLMGQSGAGKTTLLRVLAGLEEAKGTVVVEGESWQSVPPQHRHIGFVFQDYALFEHMTVEENLLFVKEDKTLANKLLGLTELTGLAKRNVRHLSGGQKQRVSLCRALMNNPNVLLMDEPLSALDPQIRQKLQHDILMLHKEFKTTTIMVSHDPSEIYKLADRVIVLDQGKVVNDAIIEHVSNNVNILVVAFALL